MNRSFGTSRGIVSRYAPFAAVAMAMLASAGSARAQDARKAPALRPDVQAVVAPMGSEGWIISEVYATTVPHAQVVDRMNGLFKTSGWPEEGDSAAEDASLKLVHHGANGRDTSQQGASAPMSSINRETSGKVVDTANGTFDLAPFLVSLRDMTRVNVVYLIPPGVDFHFHGLRHYEDDHVSVDVVVREGTYLYTANIKDHGLTMASLAGMPLVQEAEPPATTTATAPQDNGHAGVYATGLIIALAVGAGLLVYVWAIRLGGSRRDDST